MQLTRREKRCLVLHAEIGRMSVSVIHVTLTAPSQDCSKLVSNRRYLVRFLPLDDERKPGQGWVQIDDVTVFYERTFLMVAASTEHVCLDCL